MTPTVFCAEVLPALRVELPPTLCAKSEVGITTTPSTKAAQRELLHPHARYVR